MTVSALASAGARLLAENLDMQPLITVLSRPASFHSLSDNPTQG